MPSEQEAVEAHYAGFETGDWDAVLALLDPAIVWVEAAGSPIAGTYVGPQAVVDHVFTALREEWDGFALAVDEIVAAAGTVVALGTYSGTDHRTGRAFEARVAHVWHFENGRAVRFEQIADTAVLDAAAREPAAGGVDSAGCAPGAFAESQDVCPR